VLIDGMKARLTNISGTFSIPRQGTLTFDYLFYNSRPVVQRQYWQVYKLDLSNPRMRTMAETFHAQFADPGRYDFFLGIEYNGTPLDETEVGDKNWNIPNSGILKFKSCYFRKKPPLSDREFVSFLQQVSCQNSELLKLEMLHMTSQGNFFVTVTMLGILTHEFTTVQSQKECVRLMYPYISDTHLEEDVRLILEKSTLDRHVWVSILNAGKFGKVYKDEDSRRGTPNLTLPPIKKHSFHSQLSFKGFNHVEEKRDYLGTQNDRVQLKTLHYSS